MTLSSRVTLSILGNFIVCTPILHQFDLELVFLLYLLDYLSNFLVLAEFSFFCEKSTILGPRSEACSNSEKLCPVKCWSERTKKWLYFASFVLN